MPRRLLGVGWALLACLLAPGLHAAPCTKTLAWSDDPPHTMRLADGAVGGVEVDLHRLLLAALGCELVFKEVPFARALAELEAGRIDVVPSTLARPEREAYARFSQPLLALHNVLVVRKADLPRVAGRRLAALVDDGWRIGGQVGVMYGSEFAALLEHPDRQQQVVQVPYRPSLWKMLARGRVDGVMANELTARWDLAQLGLADQLSLTALTLPVERGGSAWSRRTTDAAFVRRFDAALEQLRRSPRYAALLASYGMGPTGQRRP